MLQQAPNLLSPMSTKVTPLPPTPDAPAAFPVEICEKIIVAVSEHAVQRGVNGIDWESLDIRTCTLYNCALTCSAWLETSRRCLYRQVIVKTYRNRVLHRLGRTLRAVEHLRALVDEVVLAMDLNRSEDLHGTHMVLTFLALTAGLMPRLRSLTIQHDGWKMDQYIPLSFTPSGRPLLSLLTIHSLRLHRNSIAFAEFVRMLSCIPQLQELTISCVFWRRPSLSTSQWKCFVQPRIQWRIHRLYYYQDPNYRADLEGLVSYGRALRRMPALTTVLQRQDSQSVALWTVLAIFGPALETLIIGSDSLASYTSTEGEVILSP